MKKFHSLLPALALICTLGLMVPQPTQAQWNIGASYEIREDTPKHGFGFKVEKSVLQSMPVIEARLRGHISYFSEDFEGLDNLPQVNGNYKYYDYGLAAMVGANIAIVTPYVGLGLGATTFDVNFDSVPQGSPLDQTESESEFHWNYFAGVELSPIPLLHPFVEYRFYNLDEPDFANTSTGRLILGVSLAL